MGPSGSRPVEQDGAENPLAAFGGFLFWLVVVWCDGRASLTWGSPGARPSVLLHPEEAQCRKVKQSWGSGEDPAKPHAVAELNPPCGSTPKNAVEKIKPLIRCTSSALKGVIATEKLSPGRYLAHLVLLFHYPANKRNSNTFTRSIHTAPYTLYIAVSCSPLNLWMLTSLSAALMNQSMS